ncbi:hypothetical protein OAK75_00550 [Bacteriovoracales bacterium]|nr:hypothetical protein [Bacteriovoracales bacterium]
MADCLFPILFAFLIKEMGKDLVSPKNSKLCIVVIIFWIASYFTPALNEAYEAGTFLSSNLVIIIGAIYLVVIAWTFFQITLFYGKEFTAKIILWSGLFYGGIGLSALLLHLVFGVETSLVCFKCTSSNYFAGFPRIKGFSLSINAFGFHIFSSLVALLMLIETKISKIRAFQAVFLFICIFFSFSKTMIIAGLCYAFYFSKKLFNKTKFIPRLVLISGILFYLGITHFVYVKDQESLNTLSEKCPVCVTSDIKESFPYNKTNLYPSLFAELKKTYWKLGIKNFPWGMGAINKFSNHTRPHSTFFERFALHGILGILSFLFLVFLIFKNSRKEKLKNDNYNIVMNLFWLMALMIGLNGDILRFRELWVFIGFSLALANEKGPSNCS